MQRGVEAGQQTLRRRFFVTGGAVDLTSEKQPGDGAGFERGFEAARVVEIVFNRIAGAQDMCALTALHRAYQSQLHVKRQAGRDAVGVDFAGRQALRFEKNLVAVFACKTVNFVFNTWAVTRPDAFDHAGKHGRAVQPAANDVVGLLVGVRDPARQLARVHVSPAKVGKHWQRVVAGLHRQPGEVDGVAIKTRRRTGLEAALRQLQLFEARAERLGRRVTRAPGFVMVQANMDQPRQKGARREHHGAAFEGNAELGNRTRDTLFAAHGLDHQVIAGLLKQGKVGLVFQT